MNNKILGAVYILIGLMPLISNLLMGNAQYFLWFSNHTFLIMGIAVFFSSRWWVMAELSFGLIPEAVWCVDYFAKIFTGNYIWGFTDYMFNSNGGFVWQHAYSLSHVLFIPAALFAMYALKGRINFAWVGSLIHGLAIYGISFLLPVYNLNCVYSSCLPVELPFYFVSYPLIMAAMIVMTFFALRLFYKST